MRTYPERDWRGYAAISLRGFLMGMADVVPGVSGGTMAFILGIYDELIDAIRAVVPFLRHLFTGQLQKAFSEFPWRFLLALVTGIVLAILSLARFLHWALDAYPVLVDALFFGLILGSVYVVRRRVQHWSPAAYLIVALFAAFAYQLVGLHSAQTPETLDFIFLSGMLAICAMILPGISGAFILVLLGKYQYMLSALVHFRIPIIIVFILGAATGLILFANLLRWLLDHYHDLTVAALLGFMIGSLRKLWPWKIAGLNTLPESLNAEVWLAALITMLGLSLVIIIESRAERHQRRKT